jgi:hypothetical protein
VTEVALWDEGALLLHCPDMTIDLGIVLTHMTRVVVRGSVWRRAERLPRKVPKDETRWYTCASTSLGGHRTVDVQVATVANGTGRYYAYLSQLYPVDNRFDVGVRAGIKLCSTRQFDVGVRAGIKLCSTRQAKHAPICTTWLPAYMVLRIADTTYTTDDM